LGHSLLYSKVLVPVDGSENSNRALKHALSLSSKLKSKLTILYVLEVPPFVYVQSQKLVDSVMASLEKEAKNILDAAQNQAKEFDVEYETALLKGDNIASIIIDYNKKNDFDIIVIGSRGHGKIKTTLLGSVSNNVLHHSKNPVLIIK
jgi:nucleotide-binding universal stress UspA family protein